MSRSVKVRFPALIFVLMLACLLAPKALAGETPYEQIKGNALNALFMETTVLSEYQRIGTGIQNDKFTETHHANGDTDYQEFGTPKIKGSWQIVGEDKICYRYAGNQVFTQTYCFFVFKSGSCYYNFGASEMSLIGPYNWDLWTSRFVRKGDGGSCNEPVS
jgi:hypothetical protein